MADIRVAVDRALLARIQVLAEALLAAHAGTAGERVRADHAEEELAKANGELQALKDELVRALEAANGERGLHVACKAALDAASAQLDNRWKEQAELTVERDQLRAACRRAVEKDDLSNRQIDSLRKDLASFEATRAELNRFKVAVQDAAGGVPRKFSYPHSDGPVGVFEIRLVNGATLGPDGLVKVTRKAPQYRKARK